MISLFVVATGGREPVTTPANADLERLTRLLDIVTSRGDRTTALILRGRIAAVRKASTTEIRRAA